MGPAAQPLLPPRAQSRALLRIAVFTTMICFTQGESSLSWKGMIAGFPTGTSHLQVVLPLCHKIRHLYVLPALPPF